MPIYVYEVIGSEPRERFEVMQRITAPALTAHPETGAPVRRIPAVPSIRTRSFKVDMSDKNLKAKGFTKYTAVDKGKYEKVAGTGPKTLG